MKKLISLIILCFAVSAWAKDEETGISYVIDDTVASVAVTMEGRDILDTLYWNIVDGNWQRRPDRWTFRVDVVKTDSIGTVIATLPEIYKWDYAYRFDTTWIPLCPVFRDTTIHQKINWDSLEVEINKAIKRVIEKMK